MFCEMIVHLLVIIISEQKFKQFQIQTSRQFIYVITINIGTS